MTPPRRQGNQKPQCVLWCTRGRRRAARSCLCLPNTHKVRERKDNASARRTDLMERTEEVAQVRESMNDGIIITNNSCIDKPHPQKRCPLILLGK
jgi:hypothetical protein